MTKVVTISADKGGTAVRQEAAMKRAKEDLQRLMAKATRVVSVTPKEDESKFEFIAVVELPEEEKFVKPASKKEK